MTTTVSSPVDPGPRCDRHVGEVFPPRCVDCEQEIDSEPGTRSRFGVYSQVVCPFHPGYFIPCDRCARDRGDR